MIIDDIYNEIKNTKGNLTMSEFSRDYLGTDRNYYSVMKSRCKDASGDVLIRLYGNLRKKASIYEELSNDPALSTSELYKEKSVRLYEIANIALCRTLEEKLS